MSSESLQHKLDRVRRPRVHITYDVETNGALEKKELPFVVGVIADLSGQPKEGLKALRDRKFVNIDRDNFNTVMKQSAPRVAFRVNNKLSDDGTQIPVELQFNQMDDFEPARVAQQIEPLRKLLDAREQLTRLLTKMDGNNKLEELLSEVMSNTDKAKSLAKQLGVGGELGSEASKGE
ncbi:MAG: type VI secretion system contractile sheath small subunit [Planctomycetia bacterium]